MVVVEYLRWGRKAYPRGYPKLKHWATSPFSVMGERAKAKALAYLEATTRGEA
jgi:hypothetical protein